MKIVLFQPEIPQNTGNIARTCVVTGNSLVLVKPLGFSLSEKQTRRAGLDYWNQLDLTLIDDLPTFLQMHVGNFYFFSSHASQCYTQIPYKENDCLIFGSETSGLPPIFHEKWPHLFYTIAQKDKTRCLNVSNAVAVIIYESWRQQQFVGARPLQRESK